MFFGQPTSTIAYTKDETIYIPENRIREPRSDYRFVPLRGYGYVQAVFSGEECIGWIDKEDIKQFSTAQTEIQFDSIQG